MILIFHTPVLFYPLPLEPIVSYTIAVTERLQVLNLLMPIPRQFYALLIASYLTVSALKYAKRNQF